VAVATLASTPALASDNDGDDFKFDHEPSKGRPAAALNGALKNAHGQVKSNPSVRSKPWTSACGGPAHPNTDFDFFVIQIPDKPFGLAWYRGISRPIRTERATAGSSAVSASRPSLFRWPVFRLPSCSTMRFRMLRWDP
jgi:hypothetical protein